MEMRQTKGIKSDVELGQIDPTLLPPSVDIIMYDGRRKDNQMYIIPLYRAALRGDWETARLIHKEHPNCFLEKISKYGDTALHIAAAGKRSYFVNQALMEAMITADQLETQNTAGNTAFALAAASGALDIVLEMERRNSKLPYIQGSNDLRPIQMAALLGHSNVIRHLLPCFYHLSKEERIDLIIATINTELYDVALEIFEMDATLAIVRNANGETPLHVLARKPGKQNQGLLNTCLNLSNLWGYGVLTEEYARIQLVKRLWDQVIQQSQTIVSDVLSSPRPRLVFSAIEMGNFEFVTILIRGYPDLIWDIDEDHRSIFHAAVLYRQERIFGHIYAIDGIGHLLMTQKEPLTGNNILHLAATLPPEDRLKSLPGPALQMQRELLWFKVVGDFISPEYAEMKNNNGETPHALFIKEHKKLKKEGEKWMKSTAISSMVLATLIAVIVFQAIYHLPKIKFKSKISPSSVVLLYALSLLASASSILTFLTILSSRFTQEDFLQSLPFKIMVGMLLLFISMITMLAASTTTVFVIFPNKWGTMITILAWITSTFYIRQYMPLMVDVFWSIFGSRYLFWSRCRLF